MAKKKKDIPMPMQLGSVKKQPAGIKIVCRILKYLFLALIVAISIGPYSEIFLKQYHYCISQRSCYSLLRSNVCIRCSKI